MWRELTHDRTAWPQVRVVAATAGDEYSVVVGAAGEVYSFGCGQSAQLPPIHTSVSHLSFTRMHTYPSHLC